MSNGINGDEDVARLVIPDELLTEYMSEAEIELPEKATWSTRRIVGFRSYKNCFKLIIIQTLGFGNLRHWRIDTNLHYSSFYMAFYSAVIVTLVVLLPHQVEGFVGTENKGKALGSMLTVGNVLLVTALPFTGLLSDKITTPIGKRKPLIIGGSLLFCVGLIGCALSTNYYMLCIFFSLLCLMNAFQTPSYQAVVQDLVPVQQRGTVSSVVQSFGQFGALLGGVYGLFLGTYLSIQSVYFILVGFYLVVLTISMLSFREKIQLPKQPTKYEEIDEEIREYKPRTIGAWLKNFFYPMKSANFRWFLVMVFLNNCGDSLFRSFLQYYYLDSYKEFDFFGLLTFNRATAASGFSSVIMYSCAVGMSLSSQWISKRVPRRIMSSFAQIFFLIPPIVLMLTQSFTLDICMFVVYGIGYGMYNGILWAFVADVVDDLFANSREDEHALISNAKDMGLWQTISLLSKVVVPGVGGFILDTFETIGNENGVPRLGYICIYSLAAVIFILSGLAALKIRVSNDKVRSRH